MRTGWKCRLAGAALSLTALLAPGPAPAADADWPTRPIKAIVPYPPGGGTDVIVRPFAEVLSRAFGQPWVVENRSGAAGAVGAEAAARAAPDGYTFYTGPTHPLVIVPNIRKTAYHRQDFVPVARLGTFLAGFVVHPSVPANTFGELIALAKAKPGSLAYGSTGIAGISHLRLAVLNHVAGVDITHVPFGGGADALNGLLGGHIQMMVENIVFPHVKSGRLRMLAMMADQRHPDFPDVPTIWEAGYPEVNTPFWFGIFAPAGTPQPIIEHINAEVVKAARTPEMRDRMLALGFGMADENPAALQTMIAADDALYAKWVKETGISNE